MALFSRRGKGDDTPAAPAASADDTGKDAAASTPATPVEPAPPAEPVPHVGISVSTFGQGPESARPVADALATGNAPAAEATAPAATESMPGLPDNVLLRQALRALPADPQPIHIMNVMRQALQGELYVRAQGDAQELLAAGKGLNLAIVTHADKRFLLVYSGGEPIQASVQAENGAPTPALRQAAYNVLRTAIDSGYDGISLDHASPGARIVLPIELIKKALEEAAPAPFELKNLLASPRGDTTVAEVADVLTRVPVWAAGNTGPDGRIGLAEARGGDGAEGVRRLEVYSHPLEVIAVGRGDGPLRLTPEQLARALASEPSLTGIVIDPAGPWIEVDRAALAPVLALAD